MDLKMIDGYLVGLHKDIKNDSGKWCGAVGPIAYKNGVAYSCNTYSHLPNLVEIRFELEMPWRKPECAECRRHVEIAKNLSK